jgi:photosystem II stability/assembly factor-like uncharacterized protein
MMKFIAMLAGVILMSAPETLSQPSWTVLNHPTNRDLQTLSFLDSLNGWVAGDSGTILKTTDGGETWTQQNSGITETIVDIFFLNYQRGWAVAPWYILDTIYTYILSTTNGGDNWQSQYWLGDFLTSVFFADSLVGWMGSGLGKIIKTANGGATWTETVIEPGPFSRFPVLNVKFFSPSYGYAMGGRLEIAGVVWRTTNAGDSWTASHVSPEPVIDLHYFDSLNIVGAFSDPDFLGAGLITTTDGGENWDYRYLEIWGDAGALAVRTYAEMWVPLGFAGTYMYTLDSGSSWTDLFTPDSTAIYDAVFTDERTGYMVGERGTVLKYNYTTNVEDRKYSSVQALLHQNYPNPFNASTKIVYGIVSRELVHLEVYNVLGQEVATLVNEMKQPGTYEITWDATGFPSGMYFYKLMFGSFVQTKKLILLR